MQEFKRESYDERKAASFILRAKRLSYKMWAGKYHDKYWPTLDHEEIWIPKTGAKTRFLVSRAYGGLSERPRERQLKELRDMNFVVVVRPLTYNTDHSASLIVVGEKGTDPSPVAEWIIEHDPQSKHEDVLGVKKE